jgi:hypothetical protein
MITRALLLAGALLVLSYSYSYSNTLTSGVTNNAAANGFQWDMKDILPVPGGLIINGVIYQYTIEKEIEDSTRVRIQNENANGDGYIFRQTDDWTGVPGNTINRVIGLPNIPGELFGTGSIEVEGKGTVSDPTVRYSYRLDPCFVPLTDPSCPGYILALYNWLKENGLLGNDVDIDDPLFNEFVQKILNRETEIEEDEEADREENSNEDEEIKKLNAGASIEALADPAAQAAIMQALSTIPNFENYYAVSIQGGTYEETIVLKDKELPDNRRAMRILSQDTLHRSMVRSQYEEK